MPNAPLYPSTRNCNLDHLKEQLIKELPYIKIVISDTLTIFYLRQPTENNIDHNFSLCLLKYSPKLSDIENLKCHLFNKNGGGSLDVSSIKSDFFKLYNEIIFNNYYVTYQIIKDTNKLKHLLNGVNHFALLVLKGTVCVNKHNESDQPLVDFKKEEILITEQQSLKALEYILSEDCLIMVFYRPKKQIIRIKRKSI